MSCPPLQPSSRGPRMSQPVQVIVRLPFKRPQNEQVENPTPIEWTPEKEEQFWEIISHARGSASFEWTALAAHLQVPLPYLLFRASKRFEENLRDLQEIKATVAAPEAQGESGKHDTRPTHGMLRRLSANQNGGAGRSSPLLSSPKTGTARLSGSGHQSALHARPPSSSSIVTLQSRGVLAFQPAASTRAVPPILSAPVSSDDEDAKSGEEEEQRKMEKDEATRRIRELHRMANFNTLAFSGHKSSLSPPPRQARPARVRPRSEASSSVRADRSAPSGSTSPQSAMSAMSQSATQPLPRREEVQSSPSPPPSILPRGRTQLRQSVMERTRVNGRDSTAASTSSSFSDISDMSTSALEEAAASVPNGPSRLSMFARTSLMRR